MKDLVVAVTAASYSGNKGAAAMLQSLITQLKRRYGNRLSVNLMSVYPAEDTKQVPFDFVRVVSCRPAELLFIAFPAAALHRLLSWLPPARRLLQKQSILKALNDADLVIDAAGVSFVDSRGLVMNVYAFLTLAVPLLLGKPIVKYSQALGTFVKKSNRALARLVLPRLHLICARGEQTRENLRSIGIERNVRLCADGAFTMEDDPAISRMVDSRCAEDPFWKDPVVGLSISSVVEKKCASLSIDYRGIMAGFIAFLNDRGFGVMIIANAARENSLKPRNNDLVVCDAVYRSLPSTARVRWYRKEMAPEEVRDYIARCHVLVASRFHAMVAALEKKIPVLLFGWSHKYAEVLDMFGLAQYAVDYTGMSLESVIQTFESFIVREEEIRKGISLHYDAVMESSRENSRQICMVIDSLESEPRARPRMFDLNHPERYMGDFLALRKGYAADESIRRVAASGGVATALLCHLLQTAQIDGAWVTAGLVEDAKPSYRSFIATTQEELRSCSSSLYMDVPLLRHIDMVRAFRGRLAVVLTPCQTEGLARILERDPDLKGKIILKIALNCSGVHAEEATLLPLKKAGISLENAERIFYRRGHWRGQSSVRYRDGRERNFSYTRTLCVYRNAYFFLRQRCLYCQDQFGKFADISLGDLWLKEMKGVPIKHTGVVIRSEAALKLYKSAVRSGNIIDSSVRGKEMILSQRRALAFKYCCAAAKQVPLLKSGSRLSLDTDDPCRWNHRLAYRLAEWNRRFSKRHPRRLERIPLNLIYLYMGFIRLLLSF